MMRKNIERAAGAVAVLTGATTLAVGLAVAPADAVQGQAQRLMYVHVPAAWTAYLAFGMVFFASAAYLVTRNLAWDRRAQAAAELGVGMTALTMALGAIWGRPIWGTWWTWDPRLVTTAVMLLVYLGYLGVRALSSDTAVNARRAAVVGIIGVLDIPVVHFSVVWWRALHQPPTVLRPGGPAAIDPLMLMALFSGLIWFTAGALWVFIRRLDDLKAMSVEEQIEGEEAQMSAIAADPVLVTVSAGRAS